MNKVITARNGRTCLVSCEANARGEYLVQVLAADPAAPRRIVASSRMTMAQCWKNLGVVFETPQNFRTQGSASSYKNSQ